MDLSEAINKNFIMILDPNSYEYGDPTSFVSTYWREGLEIGIVAKNESGKVGYKSFSAPKDAKYPEYFSNFVQIASEFEIPIHAVIHSFGDSFLGQDPNYSIQRSGGQQISQFVCPLNSSFWKYMATVAREVSRYKISSLIIDEHFYPRMDYCFCRRCRVEFRKLTGLQLDTTLEEVLRDEDLLYRFVNWRSELLSASLAEIVDTFRAEKPNTPVNIVIPVDPELEWITGATMHLGLDLEQLNDLVDGIILSIMPFSPMYPLTGTDGWLQLVERIKFVMKKYPKLKTSLLLNGLDTEWDITWFTELFKEVQGHKMYATMSSGQLFNIKRELHRGVVTQF